MKTMRIDGPVAALEFVGDVKAKSRRLNYVAAAWLNVAGNTMVVVKMPPNATRELLAPVVSKVSAEMRAEAVATHFSKTGCDVAFLPHGSN